MIRGFIVLACLAATVSAGQYNKTLSIGDPAPAWADLPGVDGKKHSLAELKDKPVVVVFFTCNSCPAAVAYEDRIIALGKKHGENRGKVTFVGINVNTVDADRLDKMTDRAKTRGFNFTYLYDESQKIARDYGASYTPEFFVLGPDRRMAYMGAMDDKSPPTAATKNLLDDAIEAALAGRKPEVPETLARGCMIRFARAKR